MTSFIFEGVAEINKVLFDELRADK